MVCYTRKHKIPFQIDDEDYEFVKGYTWYCDSNGYIRATVNQKTVLLHRLIMNAPKGMEIDHVNGDKVDDRKSNLRICTHQQNVHNTKPTLNPRTSCYKGVCWHKTTKKWQAYINFHRKKKYLGLFATEEESALAYNAKAEELFGEFAWLNVITEDK